MEGGYYSNEYWLAKAFEEIWNSPNGKRTLLTGLLLIIGIGLIVTAEGSPQSIELHIHWVGGQDLGFAHFYQFGGENLDGKEMSFYSIGFGSFDINRAPSGNRLFEVFYSKTIIGNRATSIHDTS